MRSRSLFGIRKEQDAWPVHDLSIADRVSVEQPRSPEMTPIDGCSISKQCNLGIMVGESFHVICNADFLYRPIVYTNTNKRRKLNKFYVVSSF